MSPSGYLLICNTSDGLIAQLNGVLVQLQLARRLGLEPVVYLPGRSNMFGGPNPYFDEGVGPNVWDYYWEPIGPPVAELAPEIRQGRVWTLSTASELARLHRWEPKSWFMNPYGYFRTVENTADGAYPAEWWLAQRKKARVFLDDGTVRFRPQFLEQARRYAAANFSEETLGLQLRGSDKFDFGSGPNLSRKIAPEAYFPHIDRYLAGHPKCARIFVATDRRQWLDALEHAYGDRIICYAEKSLSQSDANRFHDAEEKAARGAEVIMDALLLSRCSYLIKCHAAVGEMALTLNPELEFLDLNYVAQPFEARKRPARVLCAPAIWSLSRLWRSLSEAGMGLAKVSAVDGDQIFVGRGRALYTKPDAAGKAPRSPLLSRRFLSDASSWAARALGAHCFAYASGKPVQD